MAFIQLNHTQIVLGFVATSVETLSRRLNKPYFEVFSAMKRGNVIRDFLIPNYEMLHTQSREYVDDSIIEYLSNRGITLQS